MLNTFCRTGRYLALLDGPDVASIAAIIRANMPSTRSTQQTQPLPSGSQSHEIVHKHQDQLSRKLMKLLETHLNHRLPEGCRYSADFEAHVTDHANLILLSAKCKKLRSIKGLHHSLSTASACMNNSFIEFQVPAACTTRFGQIVQIFEHRRPVVHGDGYLTESFLQVKGLRAAQIQAALPDLGRLRPELFIDYSKCAGFHDDFVISVASVVHQAAVFRYSAGTFGSVYDLLGILSITRDMYES